MHTQFNKLAINASYHPSGNYRRLREPVQRKQTKKNRKSRTKAATGTKVAPNGSKVLNLSS
jgi:hypothetical protein